MTQYVLVGCGAFALEVVEYLTATEAVDDKMVPSTVVTDVLSASPSRFDDLCQVLRYSPVLHRNPRTIQKKDEKQVLICIGSPEERHQVFLELKQFGFSFGTLVHETAWVANSASIGEGTIICPFAFIGAMAVIEANSLINTRSTVGHDVTVGMSAVLSPHCDMNGASKCGRVSFLGAGAILDPSAEIGAYTKVSSGAVVKQKFGDGFLLTGNPAKGRQMFKVRN